MSNRYPGYGPPKHERVLVDGKLSQAMSSWLEHRLPDWPGIWAACIHRTHSWRVPPRWNLGDWWEEIDAEGIAAACHAIKSFDPARGPRCGTFVYHQMLASALLRYRQEWTYALRYGLCTGEDAAAAVPEDPLEVEQDIQQVILKLTSLPPADRGLIKHLFWDGGTEVEFGTDLGISQQAVSKRKRRILGELKVSLADREHLYRKSK
jgi:RNA polymerase sigma factor (sigma-70 family)